MLEVQYLFKMPRFVWYVDSAMLPSGYGIGAGFAARRHAQVSDRDQALIDDLGPTGMYIALFSKACDAKVSRWEFDEDRC
ncbi:unnamed protein product [Umbelopsis ramanniana]